MNKHFQAIASETSTVEEFATAFSLTELDKLSNESVLSFIIDFAKYSGDQNEISKVVKQIRQHSAPYVYLRPIILIRDARAENLDKTFARQFDHIVSRGQEIQESELDSQIQTLYRWIEGLPNTDENSSDRNLTFKCLRLIVSRDIELVPVMTTTNAAGFVYPFIQPLFDKSDDSALNVLDFLDKQNLLVSDFAHKAHFCNFCSSAFLNFTENCPDCNSSNLRQDELVHHFKCGHVAPLNEFQKDHQLVCPKCGDNLKHIGVDYDKPSIVYHCNDCALTFQDPKVHVQCYSCGRVSAIDDTVQRTVKRFKFTAIGSSAATFGLDTLFTSILKTDLELYSIEEFTSFLKVEKARIARYGQSMSTVGLIHLSSLQRASEVLGKRTEQLFRELSAVFKSVFRESDIITAFNESLFLVIMTDTSAENAAIAIQRIRDELDRLLSEVFDDYDDSNVETDTIAVEDCESVEAIIAGAIRQ